MVGRITSRLECVFLHSMFEGLELCMEDFQVDVLTFLRSNQGDTVYVTFNILRAIETLGGEVQSQ